MTTKYQTPGSMSSAVLFALHLPTPLGQSMGELRYQGRVSGRHIALPVAMVRSGDLIVVRVGRAGGKTWWRNFVAPHTASIRFDGEWCTGTGHLVRPGTIEHESVEATYQRGRSHTESAIEDPFVVFELTDAAEPERSRSLRRLWFTWVTLGEFLGFALPALAGALIVHAGVPATIVAMLMAGAAEGSVLGLFQARVLRTRLSDLRTRDWVTATAAGAVVAWSVGLVPILLGDRLTSWTPWIQIPCIVAGALIMVFSLGIAQWIVLRRFTDRAVLWIWGTAVAWIVGLAAFMAVATPLWQPGQPLPLVIVIGMLGGLAMAATMAAITGAFLTRMLAGTPV